MIMRTKPRKNKSWLNQARKQIISPISFGADQRGKYRLFCRLGQGRGMRKGLLLFALFTNIK